MGRVMSQGFLDGYNGIALELPNGRKVTGKVLPLARAAYYLGLWMQRKTEPTVVHTILAEFPAEVGLAKELDELTIEEFWEVFDIFFGRRATPGAPPPISPTPAPTGTAS
jgi:hypothetical protein